MTASCKLSLSQVPQCSVHHRPLAHPPLGGPCLVVRLHLVPLLHLEVLQPLEAPLKEAWVLVHPAGKCLDSIFLLLFSF